MEIQPYDKMIETNGIKLHIVQKGDSESPLVLLLHGFPEFWYGWRQQIDFLAGMGFRVVVPDQRGYNLSDKPKGIDAYRIDNLTLDIIGLIDALKYKKATIIGHDWGGMIAWQLAIKYPERLEKLIILNIPHPKVMKKTLLKNWRQKRKSWYIFFFQIPWFPEFILSRINFALLRKVLIKSSRRGTFSETDLKQYQEAWSKKNALRSMINWYRAAFRTMFEKSVKSYIDIPTLLIWGMKDFALISDMAQPSIDLCRKGRLVFIEEASHWVQHEEPDRVNLLIKDFL
jgi:pimeloyl-ACP methyl ester carboxylesterase